MATFAIYYPKQRIAEGKEVKVSVRVTQNKLHAYIETGIYLNPSQVDKSLEIKDDDIFTTLLQIRRKYKKWVDEELGEDVASYKVSEIKEFIERKLKGDDVDFFAFTDEYLKGMTKEGRGTTAEKIRKSVRGFRDYVKKENFGCNEFSSEILKGFGDYLKTKRTITRKDQFKRDRKIVLKPLDDFGVGKYYIDLQGVFNAARNLYNDEDTGAYMIKRNPFKKLDIKVKKGGNSLRSVEIDVFRQIMEMEDTPFRRVNMARDAVLLSFMLMGMPPVDLYNANEYKNGRISYNRMKTKDRRDDAAYFSIQVCPMVAELLNRYLDPSGERVFIFHKLYADSHIFMSNMNKGLKKIQQMCGIEQNLTMYVARHTVGTILRNTFKMSKSDVSECLNHSTATTVTDYYIKKDFTVVDDANRRLLDYLAKQGN